MLAIYSQWYLRLTPLAGRQPSTQQIRLDSDQKSHLESQPSQGKILHPSVLAWPEQGYPEKSIGMRLWTSTMDGRDGTDALKTRWATSYNIHEPLDRGETDAKQVRDTHQTGAQTMTFNMFSRSAGAGTKRVKDGRNARTRDLGSLVPIPTLRFAATVILRAC